jgi:hypothetical protein
VVVWEGGHGSNGNGTSNTTAFLQNLVRMMPPMMQVMKDIGGGEIPDYLGKLTPEIKPATSINPAAEMPAIDARSSNGGVMKSVDAAVPYNAG